MALDTSCLHSTAGYETCIGRTGCKHPTCTSAALTRPSQKMASGLRRGLGSDVCTSGGQQTACLVPAQRLAAVRQRVRCVWFAHLCSTASHCNGILCRQPAVRLAGLDPVLVPKGPLLMTSKAQARSQAGIFSGSLRTWGLLDPLVVGQPLAVRVAGLDPVLVHNRPLLLDQMITSSSASCKQVQTHNAPGLLDPLVVGQPLAVRLAGLHPGLLH